MGKKAYRVYDLNTHKIFDSRDVCFYETVFPYQQLSSTISYFHYFLLMRILYVLNDTHVSLPPAAVLSMPSHRTPSSVSPTTINASLDVSSPADNTFVTTHVSPSSVTSVPVLAPRVRKLPSKFSDYIGLPSMLNHSQPDS